jgi:hypothetical protein
MDDEYRFGTRRNRRHNFLFIQIERIRANVDKNRRGAAQCDGIRRRHEREGRHDDLVTRHEVGKNARHFERGSAGMCEQSALDAQSPDQPRLALPREITVSGEFAPLDGLLEEAQLTPGNRGTVERDTWRLDFPPIVVPYGDLISDRTGGIRVHALHLDRIRPAGQASASATSIDPHGGSSWPPNC